MMDTKDAQEYKLDIEKSIAHILNQFVSDTGLPIETVTVEHVTRKIAVSEIFIDQVFKIDIDVKL